MLISRNTAKAIILEEDSVLLLKKNNKDHSIYYTLPGGTQEAGESLEHAVVREVKEEVDASISVIKLVNIYEHQKISRKDNNTIKHKIEFAFLCELNEPYQATMGSAPDPHQIAVEWVNIHQLTTRQLAPKILSQIIQHSLSAPAGIYLRMVE